MLPGKLYFTNIGKNSFVKNSKRQITGFAVLTRIQLLKVFAQGKG